MYVILWIYSWYFNGNDNNEDNVDIMLRKIIKNEETAYRFQHHNFGGLTTQETAKKMKISPRKVRQLLQSLKRKAPQLFPILTHRQHLIYELYMNIGLSTYKIAAYLNTPQSNIWNILNRLKKKGMFLSKSFKPIIVSYEKEMDEFIIHKF